MSNEKVLIDCQFYVFKMDYDEFLNFKIDNTKVVIKNYGDKYKKKNMKRIKSSLNNLNNIDNNNNNSFDYKKKKLLNDNNNYDYYIKLLDYYLSFR